LGCQIVAGRQRRRQAQKTNGRLAAWLLGSTLLCSAFPLVAHAQDDETMLGTLVVETEAVAGPQRGIVAKHSGSGAKTDTPLVETPQAVSVVTREQMDAQGAETVAQALRYTPGIHSDPSGYDIRYD